jgi:hypothetical protein
MNGRAILSLVLLVSWLEPASAQTTGVTTGAVAGTVTDQTGGALRGVLVILSGDALMGTQTAVTDVEGRYRFLVVPPGDHTLSFALAGFAGARRDDVRVGVGFVAAIDVQLALAGVAEHAAVRASPVIDRQSTAISTERPQHGRHPRGDAGRAGRRVRSRWKRRPGIVRRIRHDRG